MTTILNDVFWFMGVVSASFLAYGGWLCFDYYLTGADELPQSGKTEAAPDWPHAAHTS
jgi:hypothetical protein